MLLKALLRRINAGADTASTRVASLHRRNSPLTYERFPNLPELLLRLLCHSNSQASPTLHAQKIFPALEIVERFGVPKTSKAKVWQALLHHRASPEWSIREKAAKTTGIITEENELLDRMRELIHPRRRRSQNEVHGSLMTLRVLFARALPLHSDGPKGTSASAHDVIRHQLSDGISLDQFF